MEDYSYLPPEQELHDEDLDAVGLFVLSVVDIAQADQPLLPDFETSGEQSVSMWDYTD